MKTIARSFDNGLIVELKDEEYRQLFSLARVLSGKDSKALELVSTIDEIDLTDALKAINAFVEIKYLVNELQESLKQIDDKLMGKNEPH